MYAYGQIKGYFLSYAHFDLFAFIGPHPFGKDVGDFCLYLYVFLHLQTVCTALEMPEKHKPVAAGTILVLANLSHLCFPNYQASLCLKKKSQTKTTKKAGKGDKCTNNL